MRNLKTKLFFEPPPLPLKKISGYAPDCKNRMLIILSRKMRMKKNVELRNDTN